MKRKEQNRFKTTKPLKHPWKKLEKTLAFDPPPSTSEAALIRGLGPKAADRVRRSDLQVEVRETIFALGSG